MLKIVVPGGQERWDERNERFLHSGTKDTVLRLEHSLISISKWESKYHIPFIDSTKTDEQVLDYVRCMCLNGDVDDSVFDWLTPKNIREINDYIADPMTATVIDDKNSRKKTAEKVTSELIYYWMIAYNVPVEFEKWHINRLIMLIRVCAAKNEDPKKMSKRDIMAQNRAINAARRARLHTKG